MRPTSLNRGGPSVIPLHPRRGYRSRQILRATLISFGLGTVIIPLYQGGLVYLGIDISLMQSGFAYAWAWILTGIGGAILYGVAGYRYTRTNSRRNNDQP